MAIAIVHTSAKASSSGASTLAITITSSTLGNKLIVMAVAGGITGATSTPTCTDNKGNTYTQDDNATNYAPGGGQVRPIIFSAQDAFGGVTTITVHYTVSPTYTTGACIEVSGLVTSSPVDQINNRQQGATTAPSSGVVTTTQGSELFVAVMGCTGTSETITDQTGYSNVYKEQGGASAPNGSATYQIFSTVQTAVQENWGITSSSNSNCCIVTYKGVVVSFDPSTNYFFPQVIERPLKQARLQELRPADPGPGFFTDDPSKAIPNESFEGSYFRPHYQSPYWNFRTPPSEYSYNPGPGFFSDDPSHAIPAESWEGQWHRPHYRGPYWAYRAVPAEYAAFTNQWPDIVLTIGLGWNSFPERPTLQAKDVPDQWRDPTEALLIPTGAPATGLAFDVGGQPPQRRQPRAMAHLPADGFRPLAYSVDSALAWDPRSLQAGPQRQPRRSEQYVLAHLFLDTEANNRPPEVVSQRPAPLPWRAAEQVPPPTWTISTAPVESIGAFVVWFSQAHRPTAPAPLKQTPSVPDRFVPIGEGSECSWAGQSGIPPWTRAGRPGPPGEVPAESFLADVTIWHAWDLPANPPRYGTGQHLQPTTGEALDISLSMPDAGVFRTWDVIAQPAARQPRVASELQPTQLGSLGTLLPGIPLAFGQSFDVQPQPPRPRLPLPASVTADSLIAPQSFGVEAWRGDWGIGGRQLRIQQGPETTYGELIPTVDVTFFGTDKIAPALPVRPVPPSTIHPSPSTDYGQLVPTVDVQYFGELPSPSVPMPGPHQVRQDVPPAQLGWMLSGAPLAFGQPFDVQPSRPSPVAPRPSPLPAEPTAAALPGLLPGIPLAFAQAFDVQLHRPQPQEWAAFRPASLTVGLVRPDPEDVDRLNAWQANPTAAPRQAYQRQGSETVYGELLPAFDVQAFVAGWQAAPAGPQRPPARQSDAAVFVAPLNFAGIPLGFDQAFDVQSQPRFLAPRLRSEDEPPRALADDSALAWRSDWITPLPRRQAAPWPDTVYGELLPSLDITAFGADRTAPATPGRQTYLKPGNEALPLVTFPGVPLAFDQAFDVSIQLPRPAGRPLPDAAPPRGLIKPEVEDVDRMDAWAAIAPVPVRQRYPRGQLETAYGELLPTFDVTAFFPALPVSSTPGPGQKGRDSSQAMAPTFQASYPPIESISAFTVGMFPAERPTRANARAPGLPTPDKLYPLGEGDGTQWAWIVPGQTPRQLPTARPGPDGLPPPQAEIFDLAPVQAWVTPQPGPRQPEGRQTGEPALPILPAPEPMFFQIGATPPPQPRPAARPQAQAAADTAYQGTLSPDVVLGWNVPAQLPRRVQQPFQAGQGGETNWQGTLDRYIGWNVPAQSPGRIRPVAPGHAGEPNYQGSLTPDVVEIFNVEPQGPNYLRPIRRDGMEPDTHYQGSLTADVVHTWDVGTFSPAYRPRPYRNDGQEPDTHYQGSLTPDVLDVFGFPPQRPTAQARTVPQPSGPLEFFGCFSFFVSGPFFVVAGQIYWAGAVSGDVKVQI